jgi:chromosome segregation ATPase
MWLEFAEAMEKYTVIQLLAATPLMLVVWLIIREINGVVRGGKSPDGQQNTAQDTAKIIAETLGGIIANELKNVKEDMRADQQQNSEEHQAITAGMNEFCATMERIATLITTHDNQTQIYYDTVGQLSENLGNTNEVVGVMKTDIEQIKQDLDGMKTAIANIELQLANGVKLNSESRQAMERCITSVKTLEETLANTIQETPVIKPPDSEEPKLKTIPIGKEVTE